jgi:hypothetical protein
MLNMCAYFDAMLYAVMSVYKSKASSQASQYGDYT